MREWIARLTHPSRFRPGLVLAAAVGVTALFSAVIAVNVHLARQRLHEATHSAARLGGLLEDVSDLHEQLACVMFKAASLGDHSAEADCRRISRTIDDALLSFSGTPDSAMVPGALAVILRAHDRLKASESQVFRWLDAGYPDSALAALLAPQYTRADRDFHGAVHQTARQLTVFRTELADRFSRHLLTIARVTAVLALLFTAVWIAIVLMMRRLYRTQAQAETALRESENRYRVVVENLPQKIFLKDRNSVYISCNKGYARDVKVKPWEIAGKTDYEFFPKELAEKYRADDKRIMESGNGEEIEEKYLQHGKEVFVHTAKTPIRDDQGHVSGILGIFWDITERKNAQEKFKRAEERYRAIFENAVIGIYQSAPEGRHLSVNPALARIYGYDSPEELIASMTDIAKQLYVDPNRRVELFKHSEILNFESQVYRKDGSIIWILENTTAICDSKGNILYFVGTVEDITERKRTEEVLQVSKAHLLNAIRIAKLGYWEYDFVKDVFTFNDEFYALFRTTVEQVGGYTMAAARYAELFVHPEDIGVVAEEVRKAAESTNPNYSRQLEHRIVYGDGKTGHIAVRFQIVKDSEGRTIRSYGVNQDITEGKRAANALIESEEQLRQSQKMEAIGRMAGGIAHDFNNLLTSILGHNEITLRGLPADHPLRDGIEEVAKAAERAAGLTRQLLTFSRKQVLQPRVLDLNAIVADMEKMLRRLIGENIELLTRLQPDLGATKADPSQIEQVLMNLVMNARDAMPAGGRLIIETANVAPDEIHDWRRKKAAPELYVLLAVSDNGTGMDAETRSHIYEPFFTTKECSKGTGLGLSTVYGIVKQSGGHIWVYSESGRGSVFRIYLPRVEETVEPLTEPETSAPPHCRETIPGGE